jgi:hypothetical protein
VSVKPFADFFKSIEFVSCIIVPWAGSAFKAERIVRLLSSGDLIELVGGREPRFLVFFVKFLFVKRLLVFSDQVR